MSSQTAWSSTTIGLRFRCSARRTPISSASSWRPAPSFIRGETSSLFWARPTRLPRRAVWWNSSTAWCAAVGRLGRRTSRAQRMCCVGMPTPTCRKFSPTPSWWAAAPAPSRPRAWPKKDMSTPSANTTSCSASGPQEPARPTSPWRWPCASSWRNGSSASFSPGQRWKRASAWASCPAAWKRRSRPT